MPNDSTDALRQLPEHPNLRHLKDQAKDLVKAGRADSISDAQFKIAKLYGFASWPKLKARVDSWNQIGRLKHAIDDNDFELVKELMTDRSRRGQTHTFAHLGDKRNAAPLSRRNQTLSPTSVRRYCRTNRNSTLKHAGPHFKADTAVAESRAFRF